MGVNAKQTGDAACEIYFAFTGVTPLFSATLRARPYRHVMCADVPVKPQPGSQSRSFLPPRAPGMSRWRWLLFAAMSRFELSEDEYLHLPEATVVTSNVAIGDHSGR